MEKFFQVSPSISLKFQKLVNLEINDTQLKYLSPLFPLLTTIRTIRYLVSSRNGVFSIHIEIQVHLNNKHKALIKMNNLTFICLAQF